MKFTIGSFIPSVRGVLGDTDSAGYRHADAKILSGIVDGFRRMRSIRPDSRYVKGVLKDYTIPTDSTLAQFEVEFDERWSLGITYYAAARCFETDVVDAVNRELAAGYFKQADQVFAS